MFPFVEFLPERHKGFLGASEHFGCGDFN